MPKNRKRGENELRENFPKNQIAVFFCFVCCWLIVLSFLSARDGGLAPRKKLEG